MRAARCVTLGPIDDVVVADLPDPVPGPGEGLVRVEAAGVNFPDALLIGGRYQVVLDPPFTPGSEFAGELIAVGERGSDDDRPVPAVGDQVCGTVFQGAFAEQAVAPLRSLTAVPSAVPAEVAASFQVTYTTAFHALHTLGGVAADQWVVVLGGAGGVGLAAIDLAREAGARVVAAASTPEKRAACQEAGAEVVVDYEHEDLKAAIRAATGGAHLVIDPVGGAHAEVALRALRPGGRFVVVGFASGSIPSIPLNLVLVKGVSVHGLDLRQLGLADPELGTRTMRHLLDLMVAGRLRPRVDQRFPLDQVVEALRTVTERRAIGKVVVEPGADR
jgi:NADPH2:quinone reductase